jgi:uridylate kinase
MSETVVIKLGGSVLSRSLEEIFDFRYLTALREVLTAQQNNKYLVIVGGGFMMRHYRDLARASGLDDVKELHWIGTTFNVFHAQVVRAFWHDISDEDFLKFEDYYVSDAPIKIQNTVKLGGGGRPGHSGDVDAIIAARRCGVKRIISLKNIDGVYNRDPKADPYAKKIPEMTWQEYTNIIGDPSEHLPGANFPIDIVATHMAMENGIAFNVMNGRDLETVAKAIRGVAFDGTVIK